MYPPPGMPMMGGSIDPYTGMPMGQPMMVPIQSLGEQQQQLQQKPGAPMPHQEVPEGMEDEPEMQAQPGFFTNERGNLKVSPCAAPSFSAPSCATCNLRARAPHPRLCSATTITPPSRWTHWVLYPDSAYLLYGVSSSPNPVFWMQFVALVVKCPCLSLCLAYVVAIICTVILRYVTCANVCVRVCDGRCHLQLTPTPVICASVFSPRSSAAS